MLRLPRVEYEGAVYHVTVRMAGHAWETGRGLDPSVCLFRDDAERERFVEQLRGYRWSSYQAYAGKVKPPPWLACDPILAFFPGGSVEQRRKYRGFVEDALGEAEVEDQSAFGTTALAIGGDAFVDWIREKLIERGRDSKCAADTALRRHAEVVPAEDVLRVAARILEVHPSAFEERRRNSDLRGVAAHALCRFAGLTQREAAAVLGMNTGAAVGQQLQRLRNRVCSDPHLRDRLESLETSLHTSR
jgi:hypothetical protein